MPQSLSMLPAVGRHAWLFGALSPAASAAGDLKQSAILKKAILKKAIL